MSFATRLNCSIEEIKGIFRALYGSDEKAFSLFEKMVFYHDERCDELKALDEERLLDSNWYKRSNMLGLTMYTDLFAGDLRKLKAKIPYLKKLGISYLHLMPLLKMPEKDNDGGYAVDDFSLVDPRFGTNEDLVELTHALRENGISLCLDFVMNHTSSTHQWALKAQEGDEYYRGFYYFYEDRRIPDEYEKTMPEVFPETAPGNFVWNEKMGMWVLSTFYPYQWDLNYSNPEVLVQMMASAMNLANMGVEVFRLDAVPYIWKKLGTSCRNLEEVHYIVRLMRIVLECVAPCSILKGEVVMAPKELEAYFGTKEKPECHILYNVSMMVNFWSALASQDTRLLYRMAEDMLCFKEHCSFVNYLRCHDDIGWGLDENMERSLGIDPLAHKIYLYRFFSGDFKSSWSRGQLYNYDPDTKDARSCGTTASLCGVEDGLNHSDEEKIKMALKRDLMMHASVYAFRGFPMLSSGDEIGQLNDYSYMNDPNRALDSRNLHRSKFDWKIAKNLEGWRKEIRDGIEQLNSIRKNNELFSEEASVMTWYGHNDKVFAIRRTLGEKDLLAVMNYSDRIESARFDFFVGKYVDLITGYVLEPGNGFSIPPYGYMYLMKKEG